MAQGLEVSLQQVQHKQQAILLTNTLWLLTDGLFVICWDQVSKAEEIVSYQNELVFRQIGTVLVLEQVEYVFSTLIGLRFIPDFLVEKVEFFLGELVYEI
jgi:hypothetical protein